jgi:hypothetical protein
MHQVHPLRPRTAEDRATENLGNHPDGTPAVQFISVPEWCKRVGCSLDAGYRAARRDEIAGLFRIGKLMRINWQAFAAATFQGTEGRRATGD